MANASRGSLRAAPGGAGGGCSDRETVASRSLSSATVVSASRAQPLLQGLPEPFDLAAGLWVIRPGVDGADAERAQVGFEGHLEATPSSGVDETVVGQRHRRNAALGDPGEQDRPHQLTGRRAGGGAQPHQIPRVIVETAGDGHRATVGELPLRPVRLPAFVGPIEAESLGRRLGAFARLRVDQAASGQDPRHRRPRRHRTQPAALQGPHDRLGAVIEPRGEQLDPTIEHRSHHVRTAGRWRRQRPARLLLRSPSQPCATNRLRHL